MAHLVIHKLVPPNETLLWYVHNQEDLMLSMSLMNCAPPSNHVFMCVWFYLFLMNLILHHRLQVCCTGAFQNLKN